LIIDNQTIDQSAELQQGMPLTTIAGQTRAFYREYCTGRASTHCGQQTVETRPRCPVSGATEVFINDVYILPTEGLGALRKPILATTALFIVDELPRCGLPDIDVSGAG
jgi:hypothetical protein